jgi:pyruvate dehydrogenase E1 component alpha subunit
MPDKNILLSIYKKMLLIRRFEEKLEELFSRGLMHGTCHLCIGEEAVTAATAAAMKPADYAVGTHRGHGQALAFGLDEKKLMAEFFGRSAGLCKGNGGSMHLYDPEKGFLGTNGIVGAGVPIATGAALSIRRKGLKDRAAVCFFGDGATNEGVFYESLNMAMLWKLPVIYICENNLYAMSTSIYRSMALPDVAKKAAAFGMEAVTIDGNDAVEVYDTARKAREYALLNGPMLVVANTYRISGHSKSDSNVYRSQEEIESWRARCPVKRLAAYLMKNGCASSEELEALDAGAMKAVEDAVAFASAAPYPDPEEAASCVYMEEAGCPS